jgi:hypothetical protein
MKTKTLPSSETSEKQTASEPSPSQPCSVGNWVRPQDPDWEDWNAIDDTILVLTTKGLRLVEVPEEYHPRYDNGDPVGGDPEQFWDAWCRVDPPRNA